MAQTFYEGKLVATKRWGESQQEFRHLILGCKFNAFDLLSEMLRKLAKGEAEVSESFLEVFEMREIFIQDSKEGWWIRIDENGVLEIGEPAV